MTKAGRDVLPAFVETVALRYPKGLVSAVLKRRDQGTR